MKQSFPALLILTAILFYSFRIQDSAVTNTQQFSLISEIPSINNIGNSADEKMREVLYTLHSPALKELQFDDPGTIRINCGGGNITFGTETWIADTYYTNGSGYSSGNAIANTTNDGVYQSERFGNHSYSIHVTNGSYTVRLHFAEIYFTSSNSRLFNVNVEGGQATLTSYDVYAKAGGSNTAKIEQFTNINVTDGVLNISLTNVKDNAKISGIEIIPTVPAGNTAPTVSSPIPNQSVAANTANLTIPLSSVFSDNNGFANLTLTVSGNSNTAVVNSATISSNSLVLGFASGVSGSSTIKVKATDAGSLFVEDEFIITVSPPPVNTAPVVSTPVTDKSVVVNTASLAVALGSVFSDNNGIANLVLTVSGNTNTALVNSATIAGSTLTLGFASGQTGSSYIKVKATDAEGLSVEDEFLVQVTANTTPATLIRINSGGGNITFGTETWISDAYYSNGSGFSNGNAIANTTNDAMYQSERFGNHTYNIPVPSGSYTVKLHFAEIYFTSANQRLFNVSIEGGQATLSSYDVYVKAGGSNTAKVEQFNNINVTDGTLNISFTNVKDNAKVSGIEVISSTPAANTPPTVNSPVADQSVAFNTATLALNLANTFADNNGVANLTLSVSGNTNTAIVSSANLSGNTLNLNLAAGQSGSSLIKVKATDAEGLYVEDEFSVTILPAPANTAPVVSVPIPDQSVLVNTASLAIPLASVFSDNNGVANLTLTVSGNTNTALVNSASISSNTLTLGFASGQTGSSTIKVKATDGGGLFVEDEFTVQVTANSTPSTQIRINCGGGTQTYGSVVWSADNYYSSGSDYFESHAIANTTQDELYQSERYGNHSYNIPVPNGSYTVKLHFAEIFFTATNSRLFNVNIENGQAALTNYDIILAAGANNTAKIEQFNSINVTDGALNISLTSIKDNAKISAIEIISNGGSSNQSPVAAAGSDVTISLPTNSVSLNGNGSSDPDGSISTYAWTKYSGPSTFTITTPGEANTTVTGLVAGTYIFRLTVTDNGQATGFDDVTVIVNEASGGSPTTTFIALKASWKYLDNGSNQGTSWKQPGYNDQSWATGNGEFGYGDGDEGTVVSYGNNSTNKYITTYFRKSINISNPASFSSFALGVKRDDGVVVYVNGSEVFRSNMPSGTISYNTPATTYASDDGATIQSITLPVSSFTSGTNIIAAEIHQSDQYSSDLSFDLRLIGNAGGSSPTAQILRGPYLQVGSSTAVTLRWRSDVPTDTKISVGTTVGTYPITTSNSTLTTEHEIRITGLNPDTKYFYSFGSSTQTLQSGADNFFRTAPPSNTTRKIGFAAFGDCGRNENGFQSGSLNAYQNFVGSNPADLMLLMGDNAYDGGSEEEYTTNFFGVYGTNIIKNHIVFPSPGNHDYDGVDQGSRTHAYYQAFSMPTNGESGGVPSGTEAYYSYNWGNVHLISLDSYGSENSLLLYDTTGPQVTWLKNDLAANNNMWTVVYFHHPPYSMGSHSSDVDYEMTKIREKLVRIMERYGVDMVITGHSHDYERSYLMKNHFGTENSFDINTHAITGSTGYYNGSNNSCAYVTSSGHVNHGTVYIVAGSSGADGGVQNGYPHNALPFSVDDGGMFYFEVENNRLDAKFLRRDGVVADQFTLMKDVGKNTVINISQGSSATLTASWIGNYQWSNGSSSRSVSVSPLSSTTYTVSDEQGCITDYFTVNVSSGSRKMTAAGTVNADDNASGATDWKLYPVPVRKGQQLTITGITGKRANLQILNKEGKVVQQAVFNGLYILETKTLSSGMYYVRIVSSDKTVIKKFMITD